MRRDIRNTASKTRQNSHISTYKRGGATGKMQRKYTLEKKKQRKSGTENKEDNKKAVTSEHQS